MAKVVVKQVDYLDRAQAADLVLLLDSYAKDPMGGGAPLSEHTRENLAAKLSELAHAFSFIAYVDGKAAGLVNCFTGFSTFKCAPLVNIHDLAVLQAFRGLGISQCLLDSVTEKAKSIGACKLTLEVLSGNKVAKNAYVKYGFESYELDPSQGKAEFWEKPL